MQRSRRRAVTRRRVVPDLSRGRARLAIARRLAPMLVARMATRPGTSPAAMRPSVSLRAVGILLAAVAAGLIVLARPGSVAVRSGALALAPISTLVLVVPGHASTLDMGSRRAPCLDRSCQ